MEVEVLSCVKGEPWTQPSAAELDSERTLVFLFGASSLWDDPRLIEQVVRAFPKSVHCGCSTSGEIFGTRIQDDSLVVGAVKFTQTTVKIASAPVANSGDSRLAGETIAKQLLADDLRGVLVLSDGLNVNGSQLVRGFNAVLPDSVVVTGGLAGDGDRFERTWIIADGRPQTGLVTAVGLYGDSVHVGHGSKGGWDFFGPERLVTRSEGNVLYELDGRPALDLYKEYLGDQAEGLPATGLFFPLALRANASDENRFVRTILAVDEESNSLTFAGDIPESYMAQLMRANFDRLVTGASQAASLAKVPCCDHSLALAIAISCVGRRLVLGERTEEEIEATLDVLPEGTKQIGFYSYGELSPYVDGKCDLHNQTMTVTTLSEV